MAQITLYLDDGTEALLARAAQSSGISKSRWVAQLIRTHAENEWPEDCLALAGQFPDFPLSEDVPTAVQDDLPRLSY